MDRPFPGARLRPARGVRVLYALVAVFLALVAGVVAFVPELRLMMALFGAMLSLPLGLAVAQLRRNSPAGGGRLEVRRDGVHVEGRLAIRRTSIERAVVARDERGVTVSLGRRQGFTSVIDVGSVEEGQELVRALGLSAEQALSTFHVDSPLAATLPAWAAYPYFALLPLVLVVPILHGHGWAAALGTALWYGLLVAAGTPSALTVGRDGLLLSWLRHRQLVPYAALRGVEHDGERLVLHLADGRRRALSARWFGARFQRPGSTETGFASRAAYLDAVVDRVREAIAGGGRAEPRARAALLRKGRAVDAWVDALRGVLARGAGSFREAETTPADLWSTVEDGAAEPEARAAAAVALGPSLDDAERQRLRGVARVVVAPRLRIAIEAVADGDEERVREAMAEVEAARDSVRRA